MTTHEHVCEMMIEGLPCYKPAEWLYPPGNFWICPSCFRECNAAMRVACQHVSTLDTSHERKPEDNANDPEPDWCCCSNRMSAGLPRLPGECLKLAEALKRRDYLYSETIRLSKELIAAESKARDQQEQTERRFVEQLSALKHLEKAAELLRSPHWSEGSVHERDMWASQVDDWLEADGGEAKSQFPICDDCNKPVAQGSAKCLPCARKAANRNNPGDGGEGRVTHEEALESALKRRDYLYSETIRLSRELIAAESKARAQQEQAERELEALKVKLAETEELRAAGSREFCAQRDELSRLRREVEGDNGLRASKDAGWALAKSRLADIDSLRTERDALKVKLGEAERLISKWRQDAADIRSDGDGLQSTRVAECHEELADELDDALKSRLPPAPLQAPTEQSPIGASQAATFIDHQRRINESKASYVPAPLTREELDRPVTMGKLMSALTSDAVYSSKKFALHALADELKKDRKQVAFAGNIDIGDIISYQGQRSRVIAVSGQHGRANSVCLEPAPFCGWVGPEEPKKGGT